MVDSFDWGRVRCAVEFGPGVGVFTEAILKRLRGDASFVAIERSSELAEKTRARCSHATVVEDSAANLTEIRVTHDLPPVDAIVCGLPWASFSAALQDEIFEAMLQNAAPDATFATFAYWQGVVLPAGRRFSKKLRATFSRVNRSHTVWKNLPPAFVYRCTI